MKYTVKATNIELTDAIRSHLDDKLNMIDKYYDRVTMARLELGMPSKHHHKGEIFKAEANIQVPGTMLRVETEHEDLYAAIDQLAHMMKQVLLKHKDKERS